MSIDAAKVGLHDHERFLREYPPYSALDEAELERFVRDLQVTYHPAGQTIDMSTGLFIVRRGTVELGEEAFQSGDTLGGGVTTGTARALADTWLYELPPLPSAKWLNDPRISEFVTAGLHARLHEAGRTGGDLSTVVAADVMSEPVVAPPGTSTQRIAALMRDQRSSSVLVPLGGGEFGIVTSRDLGAKVLAEGLPASTPVEQVMSSPARTAPDDMPVVSALNLMFRHNIQHLPLRRGSEVVGTVTSGDLLRLQSRGVGYLVQELLDAPDVPSLVELGRSIPYHTVQLHQAGQPAEQVARLASYSYDALYRTAIEFAHADLGPAPCKYSWLLLGSVARRECGLNPDQDHVLLIENEEGREYFAALAADVEETLNEADVQFCDGEVMASHHLYTREEYADKIREWIHTPDPNALLNVTIFFDPRVLTGSLDVKPVRQVRMGAATSPAFTNLLIRSALARRPAVAWRGVRTDRDDTLDMKTQGLVLVVDLARIHALQVGEARPATRVRLTADGDSILSPRTREDLIGAYEYLEGLRTQLQVGQFEQGLRITNRLPMGNLSGPQQVYLREILKLINRIHSSLASRVGGL